MGELEVGVRGITRAYLQGGPVLHLLFCPNVAESWAHGKCRTNAKMTMHP